MEVKNLQTQKGFTLVEIAIVLVIIGLLLGGVLKGQELITNSKIKSVTQDIDGIQASYYAYQDRTGIIPGDTTGNGLIDKAEVTGGMWSLLRGEGFIKGESSVISGPVHALDGNFTAHGGAASGAVFTKNYICASNLENTVAQGIDVKLDDGNPQTGVIRSGTVTASSATAYSTAGTVVLCKEL